MWISMFEAPIPTYGMNGKTFKLYLKYQKYYGHSLKNDHEVIIGIWDSVNETFFEKNTNAEIDNRDIAMWWKEE